MDTILSARALMGISLGFHILYATLGVGLPLVLMISEGISLRTGDELYHSLARSWTRPAGLLFAIGAVSGTILSFELGLLWPRFMEFSGPLIGLPFWMEGYAFFLEAIFLALYLYGDKRLGRRTLFFCTIALTLAAAASAVFVISANAWMNTPAGFSMRDGEMTGGDPLRAMANPAWAHQAVHGTLAAYTATGFALAGLYALAILRGKTRPYTARGLFLAMAVGGISLPLMFASGDWASTFLAKHEEAKLAAAEAHFITMREAPLILGGWPDPEEKRVRFGIEIPKLLSLLAHRDPGAEVKGLDAFPPDTTPDPRLVHPFFNLMVGSFFLMGLISLWFWWLRLRRKDCLANRPLLWGIVLSAPFGMIALESGWLVTEFGRQPWIIGGVMRVSEGATANPHLDLIFLLFSLIYLLLTAGLMQLLLQRPGNEA